MERMDFTSFNCDFMLYSKMSNVEVAICAPLIYSFEDRYFNACVEFLKTGNAPNIEFDNYSTDLLQSAMGISYIQALIILHHMETMPEEVPNIYNPNPVE